MIPGAHLYYDFKIDDGKKVVMKSRKRKCHSFVKAFPQLLLHSMTGNVISILDTGNSSRTLKWIASAYPITTGLGMTNSTYYSSYLCALSAAANDDSYGSVIGSGTNAVAVTDYKLQIQIVQGITSGKIQHSAVVFGPPFTDLVAGISYTVVTRVFTNSSGGNVDVNEIGLYAKWNNTYNFCIIRDKLPATVTIPNGNNLTLNYTIKVII